MLFTPAYRESGGPIVPRPFYIATSTAIEKGEFVCFTPGTGIVSADGDDFDDPSLGVAAENHDGSTSGRESGTEILVYCDPDIIYKCIPATESTTTSGDATSWVDSSLTAADDIFNGGKIVITDTNDVTGFSVGDVLDITDFANSGGDCTVSGAGGTIAASMKGYIFPGKRSVGCYAFDTNADNTNLDMDTAGGTALIIVDTKWDPQLKKTTVYLKQRLHQFGNEFTAVG